ncbi:ABC transporter substrate-binding protein, partial [Vibrio parahaemolyticus]|uniref:ABC transporter substrate-binding protein n=2 Tax=Vibrionaceae TaxID=641 RepID=UPI0017994D05
LQDVVAIDEHTVRFTLSQPNFSFLANIATSHAVILSAEYGQQLAAKDHKEEIDQLPIGTGPYQIKEYQVNDLIRLERHSNYWKSPAKMEQVVFDISHRGTG